MGRPLILVILVDALGWRVVQEGLGNPWLEDLLPYRRPLDTVLGFSSGAIPALLSGTWPTENGRWLMYSRARSQSPLSVARWFSRLPARLQKSYRVSRFLHKMVERNVRGYFALYEVPWHLLPFFDLSERKPLYAPGGMDRFSTWFDGWLARGYRTRAWDWRTGETDNAREFVTACGVNNGEEADVLFWYTPGQDARQHRLGTRDTQVHEHLEWLGDQIREGVMRAKTAGRPAWVYLFSDHGMTDVTRVSDVMGAVQQEVVEACKHTPVLEGVDWLPFYDSTMARFWWMSRSGRETLRPRVLRALDELDAGQWLTPEEQKDLGVDFEDQRYGEDIFLVNPGVLISPSFMGSSPVKGMHGYHPSEPTSRAVALSNRPLATDVRHVVEVAAFLDSENEARDECLVRAS